MVRAETGDLSAAHIFHSCMQASACTACTLMIPVVSEAGTATLLADCRGLCSCFRLAHTFIEHAQCADIFFLKADTCQLGMDQHEVSRKRQLQQLSQQRRSSQKHGAEGPSLPVQVNMLAREYCDDIKRKNKPIILSHRCAGPLWGSSVACP